MTRGRLAVHAHFHQPHRADPFGGPIPADPSAAPFPDWNARIAAECYRPIAERGTLAHVSFDVGPTLAEWLVANEPATWARFVASDRPAGRDRVLPAAAARPHDPLARPHDPLARPDDAKPRPHDGPARPGNAMAGSFHHAILPLASAADRRTEIRWGIRQFELRFGRRPEGFWLPETAADLATLRDLAGEGIRYTILAPWQVADPGFDTRRPARMDLGGGRSIVAAVYDGPLSAAVSFEPGATADADAFARERVSPRLAEPPIADGAPSLAVVATDGELYGHHRPFADLFLDRLVAPGSAGADHGVDVVNLASALDEEPGRPFPTVGLVECTSWSCHHGVLRWSGECECTPDARWKAPLRGALERLAGDTDRLIEDAVGALPGRPNPAAARDAYVDVAVGVQEDAAFATRWLAVDATADDGRRFLRFMEAARWRLAMFASDGWFWDDPDRPETRQVLRCAARAARIVDAQTGSRLETDLVHALATVRSASSGTDGPGLYRRALAEVGQPPPRD